MMKKYVFLLFTIMGCLISCEKPIYDDEEDGGGEKQIQDANLMVSVFQIVQTPFSEFTRTAASKVCTRLNFAIYDQSGSRLKQINQQSSAADFGSAEFQLESGTYQLVVVGHSASGNPTMTNPAKIQFTNSIGYTDTFLYTEQVEVTAQKQELRVSLDRITSLCRFVVTDSIPSNVKKIQFRYTGGSGAFNVYTGLGSVKSTQTVTYSVTNQNQFDLYTFLHDEEGTIHISVIALDAAENVINQQEFDVPMAQNKISWLSGPFFNESDSQSSSITIDINTDWDGEMHFTF